MLIKESASKSLAENSPSSSLPPGSIWALPWRRPWESRERSGGLWPCSVCPTTGLDLSRISGLS